MSEAPVERRLAAILAADVVGYSRLMGADELGTLRALRACRRELVDPAIAARHGRIVKTTGDGLLAEFASAVDAVTCAIAMQRGAARRNKGVADDKRLVFRVGINLGDIIHEANDIFGDGVNVAARLETLCEPGGICISRAVRDQVRDKLPVAFADLGEQTVKNIARPVRAFGLTAEAIAAAPELAPGSTAPPRRRIRTWLAAAVAAIVLAGGIGAAGWWWAPPRPAPPAPAIDAGKPTPAPARASIMVLPFAEPGGETGGDYFADGLTEDIIAALGRFRELSVMSRAAAFAYKGKSPTPAEVGRDIGVRYVV
ncbi:MAG TPA: adenylate/guanylate cyclase domain-containing protein, partial [Stellaceae bacterium]|nr:adenylate/guanylate cyclase domain-containing protein [Stellaceae bacterium]